MMGATGTGAGRAAAANTELEHGLLVASAAVATPTFA